MLAYSANLLAIGWRDNTPVLPPHLASRQPLGVKGVNWHSDVYVPTQSEREEEIQWNLRYIAP